MHHGTSAALEFGIQSLRVKHLIILGHSQCGGILAAMSDAPDKADSFVNAWVSLIKMRYVGNMSADEYAKFALLKSYQHCLTFPWIQEKVAQKELMIHLWFFDIKTGQIYSYSENEKMYKPLNS
jgi:carbonic anhydrase